MGHNVDSGKPSSRNQGQGPEVELVSGLGDGISVAQQEAGPHVVVDSDHEVVYTVDHK
eukprot:gene13538-14896_t